MPDQSDDGLQRPVFFRSYGIEPSLSHKPLNDGPSELPNEHIKTPNVSITDVCKATAAAPGYFKGVKIQGIKYRDGGLWNTNPATDIFQEVAARHGNAEDSVILLINVGSEKSKSRRINSLKSELKLPRQDGNRVNDPMPDGLEKRVYTFDGPDNLKGLEINDWKFDGDGKKTFDQIRTATKCYFEDEEVLKNIDICAKKLVSIRRARAKTTQWERYAFGIRYTCRVTSDCSDSLATFSDLEDFLIHLTWEHNEFPQDGDAENWNRIQSCLKKCQETTVS
jgi:hypothetical protein